MFLFPPLFKKHLVQNIVQRFHDFKVCRVRRSDADGTGAVKLRLLLLLLLLNGCWCNNHGRCFRWHTITLSGMAEITMWQRLHQWFRRRRRRRRWCRWRHWHNHRHRCTDHYSVGPATRKHTHTHTRTHKLRAVDILTGWQRARARTVKCLQCVSGFMWRVIYVCGRICCRRR